MTENDNVTSNTNASATPEVPLEQGQPGAQEPVEGNPNPVEVSPTPDDAPELNAEPTSGAPDGQNAVAATPVSAVPNPGAVSDQKPEQTDNSERPEDGPQDVSQDRFEVPSNDEDPGVNA